MAYPALALAAIGLLVAVTSAAPRDPIAAPPGQYVWPQPQSWSHGATTVTVIAARDFFTSSQRVGDVLDQAFSRYTYLTFPHETWLDSRPPEVDGKVYVRSLTVRVDDELEGQPQLGTDESYTLMVPQKDEPCTIRAKTAYGAVRALETFSQLVVFNFTSGQYEIPGAPIRIQDRPRFAHRGVMIDTGSHFLPVKAMRFLLESMQYTKLNALHWRMTGDSAFPYQSTSSPKLWDGALSPVERYTHRDVASLVQFARVRGIRVVVEFDTPGNAASWCKGYPGICPNSTCLTPLNVASEDTFTLIESLFAEVTGGRKSTVHEPAGLFPETLLHIGGDSVDTSCWAQTPEVAAWLKDRRLTPDAAYNYFVQRVAKIATKQGRRPVVWSEAFDNMGKTLQRDTVVQFRGQDANISEAVKAGYSVLRNVVWGAPRGGQDVAREDVRWETVYSLDPCDGVGKDDQCRKSVLGANGELSADSVDASNTQMAAWPRLAALGEKLWSDRAQTADAGAALARMHRFRCILLERGVQAAPASEDADMDSCAGPTGMQSTASFYP